jgi:DNA-binding NtrC family response regulator
MGASAILVADDDPVARDLLAEVLTGAGYQVRAAGGGAECLRLAEAEPFDLALIDLRMPDLDGLQVLQRLGARQPPVPVVILTAFATIETAIQTIRAGAWDYLSKPFRIDEIKLVVAHALEAQRLVRENLQHRRALDVRYGMESLIGQSPEMVAIYKVIARLAALDTTVLLYGETGTGKELVARAIHQATPGPPPRPGRSSHRLPPTRSIGCSTTTSTARTAAQRSPGSRPASRSTATKTAPPDSSASRR